MKDPVILKEPSDEGADNDISLDKEAQAWLNDIEAINDDKLAQFVRSAAQARCDVLCGISRYNGDDKDADGNPVSMY